MKTNRFDEILRRKLESIQPDFQNQDWDKWQAFRQHATPTFWQTYGHWLGYAAATLTTALMVVLYVNQSNQNQDLLKEMQALRKQITIKNQADSVASDFASAGGIYPEGVPLTMPSSVPHSDTVYVVERRTVYLERPALAEVIENSADTRYSQQVGGTPAASEKKPRLETPQKMDIIPLPVEIPLSKTEATTGEKSIPSANESSLAAKTEADRTVSNSPNRSTNVEKSTDSGLAKNRVPSTNSLAETFSQATKPDDTERLDLGEIAALPTPAYTRPATDTYRRLQNRQSRSAQAVSDLRLAKSEKIQAVKQKTEAPVANQKVEKVTKDERLLPNFGLGLPYRVGVGQQWEGSIKSFGLWSEALLGQHWSVQTGLSWQKLEDRKFYNDRVFREKTHKDFRKEHAKPLPQSFDIFNITVGTAILRIPLNLTYRHDLGRDFALFAGGGTQLNLRAKQTLSFDFKRPTNDFGQQKAERTVPVPLLNNMSVLLGAEKRWSPIVLQASAFLSTQPKASPYLTEGTDIGLQVKILYEIGGGKKK